MKNKQTIIVFDYETGCTNPYITEPIQLAAVAINPSTLEVDVKNAFSSLMKPEDFSKLTKEALDTNKKTIEELETAPSRKLVWSDFVYWVKQYDKIGKYWSAPISCGHNTLGFDLIIHDRLCHQFGNFNEETGLQNIFSNYMKIDLLPWMFTWFEGTNDLERYKLDVLRDYFGISREGAHDALVDVTQTAQLVSRFLKFQRGLYNAYKGSLKGAFSK